MAGSSKGSHNSQVSNSPMLHVFGLRRKPNNPEKPMQTWGVHADSSQKGLLSQLGLKLGTFLLWEECYPLSHHAMHSPKCVTLNSRSVECSCHIHQLSMTLPPRGNPNQHEQQEHANSTQKRVTLHFFLLLINMQMYPFQLLNCWLAASGLQRSGLQWAADCNISRVSQCSSLAPETDYLSYTCITCTTSI